MDVSKQDYRDATPEKSTNGVTTEAQLTAEKELGENIGCATFSFTLGLILLIAPASQIALPSETGDRALNRWGQAGLIVGTPMTLLSVWGGISAICSAKAAKRQRLRKTFFRLLSDQQGKLQLLTFCRSADITGDEARMYLDERAREFNATFELGEDGGVTYIFNMEKG